MAISLSWMLWYLSPVKYWRAAPNDSGGSTRRSASIPIFKRTDDLVLPLEYTASTSGIETKKSIVFDGFLEITRTSRTPTVSCILRMEPAGDLDVLVISKKPSKAMDFF